MITAAVLKEIENGVFQPEKLADEAELGKIELNKLILCVKACDGTYHKVNSDISQILKENRTALANGGFQAVISKFYDEEVHGQRFLVYPNNRQALLIGSLFFGLKKLAKSNK